MFSGGIVSNCIIGVLFLPPSGCENITFERCTIMDVDHDNYEKFMPKEQDQPISLPEQLIDVI